MVPPFILSNNLYCDVDVIMDVNYGKHFFVFNLVMCSEKSVLRVIVWLPHGQGCDKQRPTSLTNVSFASGPCLLSSSEKRVV